MEYITLSTPPFPYFIHAGSALYRPGDRHRRRSNLNVFDIIFVEYGDLYMSDGENSYHLAENDALILHPNRTHYGYKNCSAETYFHWLHFYTTGEYTYSNSIKNESYDPYKANVYTISSSNIVIPSFQTLTQDRGTTLLNLLKQVEMVKINKYYPHENSSQAHKGILFYQELLMKILSLIIPNSDTASHNNIAYATLNYLQSHYSDNVTLSDLGNFLNVHPVHIIRCVKREYDVTPNQLLTDIRIKNARNYLLKSSLTCSEIAEMTGFSSLSYFSKVFKRVEGVSPLEYKSINTRDNQKPPAISG